ncbi:MAG: Wzy polymerase domain-containing protein [Burkholderiaceae bacterium]
MPFSTPHERALGVAASLAIALPTLIAYNLPPSATFLNQAAALVGWGVFVFMLVAALPARAPGDAGAWRGAAPLLAALALLMAAAFASPLWTGLPWSLALSSGGALAAAIGVALCGAALQRAGLGEAAFRALCIGLLVAGIAGAVIALVQVFAPSLANGSLVARSSIGGRAVGNLRQPNHLSSLLLWGIVAIVWLAGAGALRRGVALALGVLLLWAVVLSGSRTGAVGAVVLAGWGGFDRGLARYWRRALLAAPIGYGAFWLAMVAWGRLGNASEIESHFAASGDISSSRFAIWSNTLELIRAHPWTGVGFGEFNFAWSLTPFPKRPIAFFDHTHNLPLQFAVELGMPLALVVLALLGWALVRAWRIAQDADASGASALRANQPGVPALRAGVVMVVMMALHSQLEYPLWYVYFLLPTVFVWGLGLAAPAPVAEPAVVGPTRPNLLAVGAIALWLAGLASVLDYARVVVIFAPPEGAAPLAQRIAEGQHSVLFSHHADYAAATTPGLGGDPMNGFAGAPHYLLDARLMQSWAKAFDERGDRLRAVHVAQRLREFHNEQAAPFFRLCDEPDAVLTAALFQCATAPTGLSFGDFR